MALLELWRNSGFLSRCDGDPSNFHALCMKGESSLLSNLERAVVIAILALQEGTKGLMSRRQGNLLIFLELQREA